ncbi:MAG: hypothetical protein ABJE95_22130 [Byssovorax sp.]
MKAMAVLVTALALAGCNPSGAGKCSDIWEGVYGAQETDGAACSGFIGTSSEVKPDYDWWAGQFQWKQQPKGTRLKIEVKFSRPLDDRDSPAGVHFRGGFFDVAKDKYYFWEGDDRVGVKPAVQHWTEWVPTKVDITQETTVTVRQKGVDLEGFINGALVGTFKLNAEPTPGSVGVDFKTPKGKTTARVKFRDFSVSEL